MTTTIQNAQANADVIRSSYAATLDSIRARGLTTRLQARELARAYRDADEQMSNLRADATRQLSADIRAAVAKHLNLDTEWRTTHTGDEVAMVELTRARNSHDEHAAAALLATTLNERDGLVTRETIALAIELDWPHVITTYLTAHPDQEQAVTAATSAATTLRQTPDQLDAIFTVPTPAELPSWDPTTQLNPTA